MFRRVCLKNTKRIITFFTCGLLYVCGGWKYSYVWWVEIQLCVVGGNTVVCGGWKYSYVWCFWCCNVVSNL